MCARREEIFCEVMSDAAQESSHGRENMCLLMQLYTQVHHQTPLHECTNNKRNPLRMACTIPCPWPVPLAITPCHPVCVTLSLPWQPSHNP